METVPFVLLRYEFATLVVFVAGVLVGIAIMVIEG